MKKVVGQQMDVCTPVLEKYENKNATSEMSSEPFQTIHEIKTDDMNGVEKYWHNRFKSKWLRGEWYKLNPSDVKALKHWTKQWSVLN
ncbi:MAG: GIY-YIG nuclease family protein [Patescibacteria group bacterium]